MHRTTMLVALPLIPATTSAQPHIVRGTDAAAGQFPSVANIKIRAVLVNLGCTRSLNAPDWVITAGHCGMSTGEVIGSPVPLPASSFTVTLGTTKADGTGGEPHS